MFEVGLAGCCLGEAEGLVCIGMEGGWCERGGEGEVPGLGGLFVAIVLVGR